ncbi:GDSL esterase/lipase [Zea mays]|nr:GDSL esterase/lipase [Zea mays]AQL04784.1 GDSL esterase/lipase [Zea mays]AQL04785.1 GDSL esterase/lipase [Zea mays]
MRRRGQVLLLGLLPPHPEGEPVLRQEDAGPVLRPAPAVMLMMRPRAQCGYV